MLASCYIYIINYKKNTVFDKKKYIKTVKVANNY